MMTSVLVESSLALLSSAQLGNSFNRERERERERQTEREREREETVGGRDTTYGKVCQSVLLIVNNLLNAP